MKKFEIYIDGASKGNPGNAGIGVVICQEGKILRTVSNYIGRATNNIAEYAALISALQEALILKAEALEIRTDSQLLARQINKEYKVRNSNIIGLHAQAERLISAFKKVDVIHVMRENNCQADKLANEAIKQAVKDKVCVC